MTVYIVLRTYSHTYTNNSRISAYLHMIYVQACVYLCPSESHCWGPIILYVLMKLISLPFYTQPFYLRSTLNSYTRNLISVRYPEEIWAPPPNRDEIDGRPYTFIGVCVCGHHMCKNYNVFGPREVVPSDHIPSHRGPHNSCLHGRYRAMDFSSLVASRTNTSPLPTLLFRALDYRLTGVLPSDLRPPCLARVQCLWSYVKRLLVANYSHVVSLWQP